MKNTSKDTYQTLTVLVFFACALQAHARDCRPQIEGRYDGFLRGIANHCDLKAADTEKEKVLAKECFEMNFLRNNFSEVSNPKMTWSSKLTFFSPSSFSPTEDCKPAVVINVDGKNRFKEPLSKMEICLFDGPNYKLLPKNGDPSDRVCKN